MEIKLKLTRAWLYPWFCYRNRKQQAVEHDGEARRSTNKSEKIFSKPHEIEMQRWHPVRPHGCPVKSMYMYLEKQKFSSTWNKQSEIWINAIMLLYKLKYVGPTRCANRHICRNICNQFIIITKRSAICKLHLRYHKANSSIILIYLFCLCCKMRSKILK